MAANILPDGHQPAADAATCRAMPQYRAEFAILVPTEPRAALDLFGAEGERAWAGPHWDPIFLRPVPGRDESGAVFLLAPPGATSTLCYTTIFDREAGHARHVFVRGHDSVAVIDIRLHDAGARTTRAVVVYERTALHAGAAEEVRSLAAGDGAQAAEWQSAIEAYFTASGGPRL